MCILSDSKRIGNRESEIENRKERIGNREAEREEISKEHKHFIDIYINKMQQNAKIEMHKKPRDEQKDKIYETIVYKIIQKINNKDHFNQENPQQKLKELFNIKTVSLSPELLEKIEEFECFRDLIQRVQQPEKYTAILLLYLNSKREVPLFISKNIFRIKQFIDETNNRFTTQIIREEYTNVYCQFKRTYWGFTKLAKIWKIRRTPIRIQTDLYMNELDPTHKHTYHLIHKNGIYLFSLHNLARIIVDAITHQSGMFVEPLTIKNPYTNDLLSKCDLINIYLTFRHHHLRINEMFEKFFQCEFNIFEFQMKHETELRDIAIEQHAKTAAYTDLAQDVDDMLRIHKMTKKMNISPGFPQKQLVDAMRPFLKIYLLERYSFSSMTRKYSAKKLDFELKRFMDNNPLFGRRVATFTKTNNKNIFFSAQPLNQIAKQETKYITGTTEYPRYCISNYMNTHIYDEDVFYRYIDTSDSNETYFDRINEYEEDQNQYQNPDDEEDHDQYQYQQTGTQIGTQTGTVISTFVFSSLEQAPVEEIPTPSFLSGMAQLENTRTPQQIRETTLTILNRLERIRSAFEREQQELVTNDTEEDEEIINNTEEDEEEEDEDAESEEEDNDADSEEEDDDADSVS